MPANCDIFIDIVIEMDFEEPYEEKERITILQQQVQVVQGAAEKKLLSSSTVRNDSGSGVHIRPCPTSRATCYVH